MTHCRSVGARALQPESRTHENPPVVARTPRSSREASVNVTPNTYCNRVATIEDGQKRTTGALGNSIAAVSDDSRSSTTGSH